MHALSELCQHKILKDIWSSTSCRIFSLCIFITTSFRILRQRDRSLLSTHIKTEEVGFLVNFLPCNWPRFRENSTQTRVFLRYIEHKRRTIYHSPHHVYALSSCSLSWLQIWMCFWRDVLNDLYFLSPPHISEIKVMISVNGIQALAQWNDSITKLRFFSLITRYLSAVHRPSNTDNHGCIPLKLNQAACSKNGLSILNRNDCVDKWRYHS